ncbi:MAG: hypothetical protein ACREDR_08395 [Blastocatellia bacterium]
MNFFFKCLMTLFLIATTVAPGSSRLSHPSGNSVQVNPSRISFQIAAIEEVGPQTQFLSRSTVEGPPGTDFTVMLHGNSIKMDARFLTDIEPNGQVRLRAKVKTDRLYGYSEHKLPLYEEAELADDLKVGFDEAIRLYPFGQNGKDNLRIEITPVKTANPVYDAAGAPLPLTINPFEVTPANPVHLTATKQPHHFSVHATLIRDGVEIASGRADCLLQEPSEFVLSPIGPAPNTSQLTLNLRVDEYMRGRPADSVSINFSLYRDAGPAAEPLPVALDSAGTGSLGSPLTYDLSPVYPGAGGHRISLKLQIDVDPGETVY